MAAACELTLVDRPSSAGLTISFGLGSSQPETIRDCFELYRSAGLAAWGEAGSIASSDVLEAARLADSLFFLRNDGSLGPLNPRLRFFRDARPCDLDDRLKPGEQIVLTVDRSRCGYDRNWPAYLQRRWNLRRDVYERFVTRVLAKAYGAEVESILALDSPGKRWKFIEAIAARIHAAPFETYSRYQQPHIAFKSCDRALDSIIAGDGGVCAEKAMAFYFIVHAYGIPVELVLGGEEALGPFPYRELRRLLDQPQFDFRGTERVQRYWEHFAVLCQVGPKPEEYVLCDVANSNIPLLVWSRRTAQPYLEAEPKRPLQVRLTVEDLRLYYHRIPQHQDIPLDLAYAMEHFIDFMDLVQTVDNELGLLVAPDFWIGVIAYANPWEREQIVRAYEQTLLRAGRHPDHDLCFAPRLAESSHTLVHEFRKMHSREFQRIASSHRCLRRRIDAANRPLKYELEYVLLGLRSRSARSPS